MVTKKINKYTIRDIVLVIVSFLIICSLFVLSYFIEVKGDTGEAEKTATELVIEKKEINREEIDRKVLEIIGMMFPGITGFDELDGVFRLMERSKIAGYAFIAEGNGYGGRMEILVATNAGFSIKGIYLLYHNETEGIGSGIEEEPFTGQFIGLKVNQVLLRAEGGEISGIDGAFVSSNAVVEAVRKRLEEAIELSKGFKEIETYFDHDRKTEIADEEQETGVSLIEEETEEIDKTTEIPKISPTINLIIYEGPIYVESDDICYWRIEAITDGSPEPQIEFSIDNSLGNLGTNRAQINLGYNETVSVIATAKNGVGEASSVIELSWACGERPKNNNQDQSTSGSTSKPDAVTKPSPKGD